MLVGGSVLSTQVVFATQRNGTQAVPYGFAGRFYLCVRCSFSAERCKALSVTYGDSSPKGRAKWGGLLQRRSHF